MTQVATHGVNTSVFGRKLHAGNGVSFKLSRSGGGSYSARYSRETGSEGRSRSLKYHALGTAFQADKKA